MPTTTIVDASVPNAGRVYDYLLGGHHNFEIDRRAGEQLRSLIPFLPKLMRLFRWCLQDLAYELTYVRGYDAIVDFASGLPTVDHLHGAVAPGTTVIYSDRDPVSVEYALEILENTPNVHYFQADCRYPIDYLNRPEIQSLLKGKRKIAYIYWGISMYLTDAEIAKISQDLHDYTDDSSTLAFYLQPYDPDSDIGREVMALYSKMGDPLQFRTLPRFKELFKPWVADDLGFRTMEEWHGVESPLDPEEKRYFPDGTVGYGVYLVKGK
ncbi:MAG: SAM-dependent methyltransferase [Anaerolineae bacterium]|nr:SAM-dependent methyltransferase [Anaerolineae bacterium]